MPGAKAEYCAKNREKHVRQLLEADRFIHPSIETADYAVIDVPSERTVYRLWPLSDRSSMAAIAAEGRRMAVASAVQESMTADAGLPLGLPRATYATPLSRKQVPVVVVDPVGGGTPTSVKASEGVDLQRLLIGQWVMGRPNPTWSDLVRDEHGRLAARRLAPHAGPLSEVWREAANRGPSRLFMDPSGKDLSPMAGQPLDESLRERLRGIDLRKVEDAMASVARRLDEASDADKDAAFVPRRAIHEMLAPLRALIDVVNDSTRENLPLEMLMADVGERLREIDLASRAAAAAR